jgi:hypothetical protein
MANFDLTPKTPTPPELTSWGSSSVNLPVADQDQNHVSSLRELERDFHVRVRLDSINIHKNTWPSELMQLVYLHSYPLRKLMETRTTVKISHEWLDYWEVFSQTIIPGWTSRMQKRVNAARERAVARAREVSISLRGIPVRTFHIRDDHAATIQTMQKAINRVEFETGAQINWDWLATYTPAATDADKLEHSKNKSKWNIGVDGEGRVSIANMRAWKNKIATQLKVVDIIIDNNTSEVDKPSGIAFVLMNLAAGGSATVLIPRIATTAIVAMIHLFTQCFENSNIIHTLAADHMHLTGTGFLDNLSSKQHKLLYEFCELYPDTDALSPFTSAYIESDAFTETLDKLMEINRAIQRWRYEYYEKLLLTYTKLYKSNASKTFTGYITQVLDDTYKDESQKWIVATNFNYFARDN